MARKAKAVRVQLSRAKGWKLPPNTVVVSRPTKWGNPFVVGKNGPAAECVLKYKAMLGGFMCLCDEPTMGHQELACLYARENIKTLRGKNLACWCRIGQPCHADVLMAVAAGKPLDLRFLQRVG